jgi:hypothetical protein
MRTKELGTLYAAAKGFFESLRKFDPQDISDPKLQELVTASHLNYEDFADRFTVAPK